jgi:DNA polymerase III subunit gamma/tau
MAYTVLARRYRSNTFDEVVGQDHIAQTLKKAIESGRIAHAYLFCGTRGTGKTSTARILAKCLNCQSADHPVTEPCGKCDSCKSIARGEDIDVIEIDAASNTGVDDVRDVIIGTAYNSPARSRFKVFIIDEVHMLSKNAFNALLKTLEEPPSHVKFILATTEPEKLPATILSRCQRYDFRNIGAREIAAHLKGICKKEKITADDDALLLIAKAGAGSMRDSLSLLDRLLSADEKKLTVETIEQLLGLPKIQSIFNLVDAIGGSDVKAVLSQTQSLIDGGLSVDSLLATLIDHLRNLLVLRTCGADSNLIEIPGLTMSDLVKQADKFDSAALSQDIVILEELRRNARQSQAGRALLDATLVRMTLADQFASLSDLMGRISGGASTGAAPEKKKPVEIAVPVRAPPTPVSPPTPPVEESPADTIEEDDDDSLPVPGRVWEGPKKSLATMMAESAPPPLLPSPKIEAIGSDDLPGQWQAMLDLLVKHGAGLHGVLSQGKFVGIEDGRAVIRVSRTYEAFIRRIEENGKKDAIRNVISEVLKQPVGVRFDLDDAPPQPIATAAQPRRATATATISPAPEQSSTTNTIQITDEVRGKLYESEPLIRAIVDQLGGRIMKLEE